MKKSLGVMIAAVVGLLVVIGVVALAIWDIPAPETTVEKVIPNERFTK